MLPRLVALPHSPERWSAGSYFYARDSGRCPADFVGVLPPLSLSVICSRAPSREIIASPCPPVGFDQGFGLAITGYVPTSRKHKVAGDRASPGNPPIKTARRAGGSSLAGPLRPVRASRRRWCDRQCGPPA